MLQGDRDLFDTLRAAHWPTICSQMCSEAPTRELADLLRSRWTEYGGRIRVDTGDDALLVRALRAWLPMYRGPEMTLLRGESIERYQAGRLGFCWTPNRETAEMFASGLQADYPGGGCLLQCLAPPDAILAAPDAHSRWLGEEEYVLDPTKLGDVEVVTRYPRPQRR
ncbi:hypothetical protein EJP67_02345 [Variovorax guangxiensis]|uniref:Uncharacterized protein n=1 Tax=Variovorax guangxiensis TaxID=1775474 RepID=A0A433MDQ6_9BURK|nr:hypothetical protein [Variovorax guangxiensis]RUR65894.1 hypothetical protein EJP67_02345 [Variovorax guangxiensis]